MTEHARLINEAMSALSRYELQACARQPFGSLSGVRRATREELEPVVGAKAAAAA